MLLSGSASLVTRSGACSSSCFASAKLWPVSRIRRAVMSSARASRPSRTASFTASSRAASTSSPSSRNRSSASVSSNTSTLISSNEASERRLVIIVRAGGARHSASSLRRSRCASSSALSTTSSTRLLASLLFIRPHRTSKPPFNCSGLVTPSNSASLPVSAVSSLPRRSIQYRPSGKSSANS